MAEKKLVLQCSDVQIVFGGLCAVSDASFDLFEGELVGLIGPNGAGKTTMFNMVSGIYTPTSGQICFWDKDDKVHNINKFDPARLNKLGIARTFQNIRLFGELSVKDNVLIALHNQRRVSVFDVLFRTPKFRRDEQLMSEKAMNLLELFKIIPRRMNGVNAVANNMAKTDADFQNIINREDSLLSVMKTAVKMDSKKKDLTKDDEKNVLEAMGLEIYPATDKQKDSVLAHLGDSLKPKVKQVYRVINKKTQKRFDTWLNDHRDVNGRKPMVKQFWHGSRNENWWSIVTNGLALNPNRFRSNVVITGKMFGNGLYFAPSSAKSFNYTSFRGTSWAGGTANTAFMALYAIEGYSVRALDYILKPVHYYSFASKMDQVMEILATRKKKTLIIHARNERIRLPLEQLLYVEVQNHTLCYHTQQKLLYATGNQSLTSTMGRAHLPTGLSN